VRPSLRAQASFFLSLSPQKPGPAQHNTSSPIKVTPHIFGLDSGLETERESRPVRALDIELGYIAGECICGDRGGGHIGECEI